MKILLIIISMTSLNAFAGSRFVGFVLHGDPATLAGTTLVVDSPFATPVSGVLSDGTAVPVVVVSNPTPVGPKNGIAKEAFDQVPNRFPASFVGQPGFINSNTYQVHQPTVEQPQAHQAQDFWHKPNQ